MRLQPADASADVAGHRRDLIADGERSVEQRAGDDRAEAGHREGAIDGEPRASDVASHGRLPENALESE